MSKNKRTPAPARGWAAALLGLLAGAGLTASAATPANQNFDSIPAGTLTAYNGSFTYSGVTYSTDTTGDRMAIDTIANITGGFTSLGTGNGLSSVWDGANTGTFLRFASVNTADNFKIVSFNCEVWGHNSLNSEIYTIKGYDNGVEKASATVNFRTTATYGTGTSTISFTRLTTAQETSSSGDGANCGTLSFTGSAWGNVDQVRIIVADPAPNNILGASIDKIVFADPVLPNTTPSFVGSTTNLAMAPNASATDIKALLHASDTDSAQTLTWSQSGAPSHGTLSFSSATASSGSSDVTPGGTITYTPTALYAGPDSFTVQVSDGTATATRIINVTVGVAQLGTASSIFSTNNTTLSGFTVPAGSNRVLVVAASDSNATNVTSVTFAGVAMTRAVQTNDGFAVDSFWYLPMGSSGSSSNGNIVMTRNGSGDRQIISAAAFQNVDQTTTVTGATKGQGSTGNPLSLTVTSKAGDLVVDLFDIYRTDSSFTQTPMTGQTLLTSQSGGLGTGFGSYKTSTKAGASSVTMTWTNNATAYIHLAMNLNQVVPFTAPVVSSVSASTANGSYNAGDVVAVTVTFDSAVNVTGTPQITLETGATDRTVNYSSGAGSTTLTFNYTVQAGDTSADLDYLSTSSLSFNGGTITGVSGGLSAVLTLPAPGAAGSLAANKALLIDTTSPTVAIGAPSASVTKGGPVSFTVTYADANFSSSTLANGNITVNSTGSASANVAVTGSGTTRTVTLSSITGDGTLGISIASGTATDTAGNTAPAAGPSTTFAVDNTAPSVAIGSPSASQTKAGPVTYTVTYSDANFSSSTLANGNVTLNSTGSASGTVNVTGSGTTRTVTISGITGSGTLGISLASGTASDTAGNTAPAAGPSTTFTVDNTAPTISSIVRVSSSPTTATSVGYTVAFAESVTGVDVSDFTLTTTGTAGGTIASISGSGTTYTVTVNAITGTGTLRLDLNGSGTGIADSVGNAISGAYTSGQTYSVSPANSAPTDIALSGNSVNQSAGANAVVGTLSATDADSGDSHTFTLVAGTGSTDNASFNISGTSLRANNAANLAAGSYSVRVRVTDSGNATFEKAFSITVVDNVAPVITSAGSASATNGTAFAYTITATGGATVFGANGLPTGLSVTSGSGLISGTPTQAGTFNAQIIATDAAGNSVTNALTLTVAKGSATATLASLSQTFDGTGKAASATTTPNGLTVALTYDGGAVLPTNAGTYVVVGTINDVNYAGAATNSLVISKAAATVTLASLSHLFDGTGKAATALTTPSGLPVTFTYNGSAVLPTNGGSYVVIGTINHTNYTGSATNNLVISLPAPVIALSRGTNFYTLGDQPTALDALASFSAPGNRPFNGGTLGVTVVSNIGPKDLLWLADQASGTNRISSSGNEVRFDGTAIATCSGGATGAQSIDFSFNANATESSVRELLRNVAFCIGEKDATNLLRVLTLNFADGTGATSAPVSLTLVLNHRPRLSIDRAVTGTNLPVFISYTRVLTNDTDIDADTLRVWSVAATSQSGATLATNATGILYMPANGFSGDDQFTYTVDDGRGGRATATVTVIVLDREHLAIEDAPFEPAAVDYSATVGVTGIPTRAYRLQASQDLIIWTTISTVTPDDSGLVKFRDTDSTNHVYRFYRTVYP